MPVVAVIGGVASAATAAGTLATAFTAGVAAAGGVMSVVTAGLTFAGGALAAIGGVTGNTKLMKIGAIAGLGGMALGAVGNLAAGAAGSASNLAGSGHMDMSGAVMGSADAAAATASVGDVSSAIDAANAQASGTGLLSTASASNDLASAINAADTAVGIPTTATPVAQVNSTFSGNGLQIQDAVKGNFGGSFTGAGADFNNGFNTAQQVASKPWWQNTEVLKAGGGLLSGLGQGAMQMMAEKDKQRAIEEARQRIEQAALGTRVVR